MSGGVVFWPWAECVVALFIYLSAIITKAKMTRIGGVELGCTQKNRIKNTHKAVNSYVLLKLNNSVGH